MIREVLRLGAFVRNHSQLEWTKLVGVTFAAVSVTVTLSVLSGAGFQLLIRPEVVIEIVGPMVPISTRAALETDEGTVGLRPGWARPNCKSWIVADGTVR